MRRGGAADPPRPAIEARRVATTQPLSGEFTYTVLIDPPADPSGDRRLAPRLRTRLRSAKVVDADGRFVTECLVHDLSATGGRLRFPPGVAVPRLIQVYDDQTGLLHAATVLWRRDRDLGVTFKPAASTPRSQRVASDMRRKFYAVRD